MGFRQAALLCSICFFLGECCNIVDREDLSDRVRDTGILFINFNVDHQILFIERNEKSVAQGYAYYTTFLRAPLAVKVRALTLRNQRKTLRDEIGAYAHAHGRRSAQLGRELHDLDRLCIVLRWNLYRCAQAVNSIGYVLTPCSALYVGSIAMYISVAIPSIRTVVEPLPDDTPQDREDALSVLGAANVLIALLLIGILGLQGGQEYAKRIEKMELDKIKAEEAKEAAAKTTVEGRTEDKKTQ